MITHFTVVRYRPNSLRDEYRNIGLVAWGADSSASTLLPGLPERLDARARDTIGRLRQHIAALGPRWSDAETIRETLEGYDGPYSDIIFRVDRGTSIEGTPQEVIDALWPTFFATTNDEHGLWAWGPDAARALTSGYIPLHAALETTATSLARLQTALRAFGFRKVAPGDPGSEGYNLEYWEVWVGGKRTKTREPYYLVCTRHGGVVEINEYIDKAWNFLAGLAESRRPRAKKQGV